MVRATSTNPKENLPMCDRYFVKGIAEARFDEVAPAAELQNRETEETGRSLADILTDLRLAGSL
ncbi:MAG: hypothetical protein H6822_10010 [Planctomycetaceae bacterium]|nr:hypothetical protein [Planctomycetales bacterium]MCB9922506.1 hypothetical protein [Planctomycetaceae bacterium]